MLGADFTKVIAWQKAHIYVLKIYAIINNFPPFEKHGLVSQYTRAAVSIPANIAEGIQKISKADKLRFLNIAQGSLSECRYYNILSRDLHYIDDKTFQEIQYIWDGVEFFLNKYISGIENNSFNSNNS